MVLGSGTAPHSSKPQKEFWPPLDAALPFHDEWVELTAPRPALVRQDEPQACPCTPEEAYASQRIETSTILSRPRNRNTVTVQCNGNRCVIERPVR